MNFYHNDYIRPSDNVMIKGKLKATDYMCKHCYRLLLSDDLINGLIEFEMKMDLPIQVLLGYQCEDYYRENGISLDKSHNRGLAVDIYFGGKAPLFPCLDNAKDCFAYVGLTRTVTKEYYLHVQHADDKLYWLCAKNDPDSDSEYVYYKNYIKFKNFIQGRPEMFRDVRI